MITLLKKVQLYAPVDEGIKDVMIAGGKIVAIDDSIDLPENLGADVVQAEEQIAVPGFIDLHVHIIGGGGEGGPGMRVPEIQLSRATLAGTTTVVGVLGTDDVGRSPEALLAKAMGLEAEGMSAYIMAGSYRLPPVTITGSLRKDLALIPKVVGVGEVALSDHRSSQPTYEDFAKLAAEARLGGILGGKPGLVHVHMGVGERGLEYLFRLAAETEIPTTQCQPTHVNRSDELFEQAVQYAKLGGNIDLTASGPKIRLPVSVYEAVQRFRREGMTLDRVTVSSDANGVMSLMDESGAVIGFAVGGLQNLFDEIRNLVVEDRFDPHEVLKMVTINPAYRIGAHRSKGSLEVGKDADLLLLHRDWVIDRVYCRGRLMVSGGEAVVRGTFEEP